MSTHHLQDNKDDVETLHDRFPPTEYQKRPPDGIAEEQKLAEAKKYFRWLYVGFSILDNLQRSNQVRRCTRGHKCGGCALRPCVRLMPPPTSSPSLLVVFQSKKNHCEGFIPFGLRLVFLFCETQRQGKKNKNWHWALG